MTLSSGTYLFENYTFNKGITTTGTVTIYIVGTCYAYGYANSSSKSPPYPAVNIKSGTLNITGTGTFTVKGNTSGAAGISNSYSTSCSSVTKTTVNIFGDVTVKATGGSYAAGIGSGMCRTDATCYENGMAHNSGSTNIYGNASVYAYGGTYGAGIGTGCGTNAASGATKIYGNAYVYAQGGQEGPGIGKGLGFNTTNRSCGTTTISGNPTVYAYGGIQAAGIGCPWDHTSSNSGSFTMSGGTVYATGGTAGAGIGGAGGAGWRNEVSRSLSSITISGGTVYATGGSYASGIGSGGAYSTSYTSACPTITISGDAFVQAVGKGGGSGIGAGLYNPCNTQPTISGGVVVAVGGKYIGSGNSATTTRSYATSSYYGADNGALIFAQSSLDSSLVLSSSVNASGGATTISVNSAHLPSGYKLTVDSAYGLTINSGKTFTNKGTVNIRGTVYREGALVDSGSVYTHVYVNGDDYGTMTTSPRDSLLWKADVTVYSVPIVEGYELRSIYLTNQSDSVEAQSTTSPLEYTVGTAALHATSDLSNVYGLTYTVNDSTWGAFTETPDSVTYNATDSVAMQSTPGYRLQALVLNYDTLDFERLSDTTFKGGFTMPAQHSTLKAIFEPQKYLVEVEEYASGVVLGVNSGSDSIAYTDTVWVAAKVSEGYYLEGIHAVDENGDTVKVTDSSGEAVSVWESGAYYIFVMPAGNVTVSASYSRGTYYLSYYNRTSEGGTLKDGPSRATAGDTVTAVFTPVAGYELSAVTVADTDVDPESFEEDADGNFTAKFLMPGYAATVYYSFKPRTYDLSYTTNIYGTVTGPETEEYLDTVTLSLNALYGYQLASLTLNDEALAWTEVNDSTYTATFIMPHEDVKIEASFVVATFDVTLEEADGGSLEFVQEDHANGVDYGSKVYIYILPDDDYSLLSLTAVGQSTGQEVEITKTNSLLASFTMPNEDVVVTPEFTNAGFSITYKENSYGTVTGETVAIAGQTVTITATPNEGYELAFLLVAGEEVEFTENEDGTYTASFTMPSYKVTVASTFTAREYNIVYNDSTGGSVSGVESANYATTVTTTISLEDGYELASVTMNGTALDTTRRSSTLYTAKFSMPASDATVAASFSRKKYLVNVESAVGGTISVSSGGTSSDSATYLDQVSIAIKPESGYTIASVKVVNEDDEEIEVTESGAYYVFTMPAEDVTVSASFTAGNSVISYYNYQTTYGSLTGDSTTATVGSTIGVTATAYDGYELLTLTQDGEDLAFEDNEDGTYSASFTMPGTSTTISSTFGPKTYTIVYDSKVANGAVSGSESASYGSSVTVEVTPESGYELETLTVTDSAGNVLTVTDKKFTMPAGKAYVTATFVASTYTISVINSSSGYGTVTAPSTAEYGSEVTVTATAEDGYELLSLIISNTSEDVEFYESTTEEGVFSGTFDMLAQNVVIVATFGKRTYDITYIATGNGSVSGTETEDVAFGATVNVTAVAESGYKLTGITMNGDALTTTASSDGVTYSTSFSMPASDATVEASFTASSYTVTIAETENGTITQASPESESVAYGETVTLSVEAAEGYSLTLITATTSDGEAVTVARTSGTEASFTMPAASVTVSATFAEGAYDIYTSLAEGTLVNVAAGAASGEEVSFTIDVEDGYSFESVTAADADGNGVTLSESDGTYSFTMPGSSVTITTTSSVETYTLTCSVEGGGTITCGDGSTTEYSYGASVEVVVTVASGYEFGGLTVNSKNVSYTTNSDGTYSYTLTMPAENVEIVASFTGETQVITYAESVGGTVTGTQRGTTGETITVYLSEETGYTVGEVTAIPDGETESVEVTCSERVCTFTMPAGDVTVTATFEPSSYSITYSLAGSYGEGTTVPEAGTAKTDEVVSFTITGVSGYTLSSLSYGSTAIDYALSETEAEVYEASFTMPAADVSITAVFELETYTITYEGSAYGTVSGTKKQQFGEEVTVVASPAEGHSLAVVGITVTDANGNEVTEIQESESVTGLYTFAMPDTSVTVSGNFTTDNYSITYNSATGASASGAESSDYGELVEITVLDSMGYTLKSLSVTNYSGEAVDATETSVTENADGTNTYAYTFTMPASQVYVTPVAKALSYSINYPESVTGGAIYGETEAAYRTSVTVTFEAEEGYEFKGCTLDGEAATCTDADGDGVYELTFTMPASDVEVGATFSGSAYSVIIDEDIVGGTVTYTGEPNYGETITVTATASSGYTFSLVTVNDVSGNAISYSGSDGVYTFAMPAGDAYVSATFDPVSYTISYSSGSNGVVTGETSVDYAAEVTALIVPNAGFEPLTVTYTEGSNDAVDITTSLTQSEDGSYAYTFTMPAANVQISATFTERYYDVAFSYEAEQGSISGEQSVKYGSTASFTVTPATGYAIDTVAAVDASNNAVIVTEGSGTGVYEFTMPSKNVTLSATFYQKTYYLTYASVEGGSASGAESALYNDETSFTVTPSAGYSLTGITVGSTAVTLESEGLAYDEESGVYTYTFTMPAEDITITPAFTKNYYEVTLEYDSELGSVTTSTSPAEFASTFSIFTSPGTGYEVGSIAAVDESGAEVSLENTGTNVYSFEVPASKVTVSIEFAAAHYTITYVNGTGGTVTGATSVVYGDSVTVTPTASAGYTLSSLTVNGVDIELPSDGSDEEPTVEEETEDGTTEEETEEETETCVETAGWNCEGTTYTFQMPAEDIKVIAGFTANSYVVNYSYDLDGGTVSGSTRASYGETVSFTAVASSGYTLSKITANDASGNALTVSESNGTYSFTMPNSQPTVTITFTPGVYEISYKSGTGGTLDGVYEADYNSTVEVTITPLDGYEFEAFTVAGVDFTEDVVTDEETGELTYSFTMPAYNVVVAATFAPKSYGISYTSVTGATFSGQTTASVGSTVYFAVAAESGYVLMGVDVDYADDGVTYCTGSDDDSEDCVEDTRQGVSLSGSGGSYSFTMPVGDVVVTAELTQSATAHSIITDAADGTSISVESGAEEGEYITFNVSVSEGYTLSGVTATYGEGSTELELTAGYCATEVEVDDDGNETETLVCSEVEYEEDATTFSYYFTMPDGDVTIKTEVKPATVTIAYSSEDASIGTVSGSASSAEVGSTVTVTITTLQAGYEISLLTIEGVDNGNETEVDLESVTESENSDGTLTYTYELTVPSYNSEVVAYFGTRTYNIAGSFDSTKSEISISGLYKYTYNVTENEDGSLDTSVVKNLSATASYGSTVTFFIDEQEGYTVGSLLVSYGGETETITSSSRSYSFTMPASDVTFEVEMIPNEYSIAYSDPVGGTMLVTGEDGESTTVGTYGETITVTLTELPGYSFATLTIDDDAVEGFTESENSDGTVTYVYTFTMPNTYLDLSASFSVNTYTLASVVDPEDAGTLSITSSGETDGTPTAATGETVGVTTTTNEGYTLSGVAVTYVDDGENEGSTNVTITGSGSYSFTMPAGATTVTASYTANTYSIYQESDTHGSLSVAKKGVYNTTITVTVTTSDGYSVSSLTATYEDSEGNTQSVSDLIDNGDGTWSFTMPAADVDLVLTTGEKEYTVSTAADPSEAGSLTVETETASAATSISAATGDEVTVTVTANNGYSISGVSVAYEGEDGTSGTVKAATVESGVYSFTMPAGNATVTASFTANTYVIYTEDDGNGSLTVANKGTYGETVTVGVSTETGYAVQSLAYEYTDENGEAQEVSVTDTDSDGNYVFTMPASDVTLKLVCGGESMKVTAAADPEAGGTVQVSTGGGTAATEISATTGETVTVSASAATGYTLSGVSASYTDSEGAAQTVKVATVSSADGTYEFTMPAASVTVTASFDANTYVIYTEDDGNGSLTVANKGTYGETVTVEVSTETGYAVQSLAYEYTDENGEAQEVSVTDTDSDGNYVFTMPASDVTLKLVCGGESMTVTATANPEAGGTVQVSTESASAASSISATTGETVIVSASAATGYTLSGVSASYTDSEGAAQTVKVATVSSADGTYEFTMPAANVTVTASFTAKTYVITYEASAVGSASGDKSANVGSTVEFSVSANEGYSSVTPSASYEDAEGATQTLSLTSGESGTYSFTMPAGNVTITLTASASTYTITYESDADGSLSGNESAQVGEVVTVTGTGNNGQNTKWVLASVTVTASSSEDGVESESIPAYPNSDGTYSFTMPASNVVVTGSFLSEDGAIEIEVTTTDGVSVSAPIYAEINVSVSFSYELEEGYSLASITVQSESNTEVETSESEGVYTFTMPSEKVTISAVAELNSFAITAELGSGLSASITAGEEAYSEGATVAYGSSVSFSFTEETGYSLGEVSITDENEDPIPYTLSDGVYTFTMPNAAVTITATSTASTYKVVDGSATGTTLEVAVDDVGAVAYGTEVSFTVAAGEGYTVTSVKATFGDTELVTASEAGTYKFTMPAADVTITTETGSASYTITKSASEGITISASDGTELATSAAYGDEVSFTVSTSDGYELGEVSITNAATGKLVPYTLSDGSYSFTMPAANVTITATNTSSTYKVVDNTATGTTLDVEVDDVGAVAYGTEVSFTVAAEEGYTVTSVKAIYGETELVTASEAGTYTFTMPAADVTITTETGSASYTITKSASEGITISASDGTELAASAAYGDEVSFTVSTSDGYELGEVSITNATTEKPIPYTLSDGTYTFTMPAANVTITAANTSSTYSITSAPATGTTIEVDVDDVGAVAYGTKVSFTVAAEGGYTVGSVSVATAGGTAVKITDEDGNEVESASAAGTYSFTMPASNVTITTTSGYDSFEIATDLGDGITLYASDEGELATSAAYGDKVSFTISVEDGYTQGTVSIESETESVPYSYSGGTYTFTMPAEAVTIAVTSTANTYGISANAGTGYTIAVDVESLDAVAYKTEVSFTVAAEDGYTVTSVTVTSANGAELVTASEAGTYTFSMPAGKVTISAETSLNTYNIETELEAGIAIEVANGETADYLDQVSFTLGTTDEGYSVGTITVTNLTTSETLDDVSQSLTDGSYKFTMPASDVKISVAHSANSFGIVQSADSHVTLTVASSANYTSEVEVGVTLEAGYALATLVVSDNANNVLDTSWNEEGTVCTFTMPAGQVTVVATSEAISYEVSYEITGGADDGTVYLNGENAAISVATAEQVSVSTTVTDGYKVYEIYARYDSDGDGEYETDVSVSGSDYDYSFTMPAGNTRVYVGFSEKSYSITYSDSLGGTVTGSSTAYAGTWVTITATADAGYTLKNFVVGGEDVADFTDNGDGTYTASFTMPTKTVVVGASFSAKSYSVTVADAVGGNVLVSPVSENLAATGTEMSITTTATSGYALTDLAIAVTYEDGTEGTVDYTGSNGSYAFTMPAGDIVITGTFEAGAYTIVIDAGDGATVDAPSGATYGSEVEATITIAKGYALDSVASYYLDTTITAGTVTTEPDTTYATNPVEFSVNGDTYSFVMPKSDLIISVYTSPNNYAVTYSVNDAEKGSVTGNVTAYVGNPVEFAVEVDSGYVVSNLSITVDETGASVDYEDLGNGGYSFTMPAGDVTVDVTFGEGEYTITYETVTGGSVTGVTSANFGTTVMLYVSEDTEYSFNRPTVMTAAGDSVSLYRQDTRRYSFTMPAANLTVTGNFYRTEYTITYSPVNGGVASGNETAVSGETVTVTIAPDPGYALTGLAVSGEALSYEYDEESGAYVAEFVMPSNAVTVTPTFISGSYTITYATAVGGTATGVESADIGETVTVTLVDNEGYTLSSVIAGTESLTFTESEDEPGTYTASFTMPANSVVVTATFEQDPYTITYEAVTGGSVSGPSTSAYAATVTIYISEDDECTFTRPTVTDADGNEISLTYVSTRSYSFTMPTSNVTVTGNFVASGEYTITYASVAGGVAEGLGSANADTEVEVILTPSEGYIPSSLAVGGETIEEFTENEDGTYSATFSMPSKSVVVIPTFVQDTYTISYYASGEGTVEGETSVKVGETVTITATAADDYKLTVLTVSGTSVEFSVDESDSSVYTASFEMPASAVSVVATFYSTAVITDSSSYYMITYESVTGGSVSGPENSIYGGIVTIYISEDEGCTFTRPTVTDESGGEIDLTIKSTRSYTFTMPSANVTVMGNFVASGEYSISYASVTGGMVEGLSSANADDVVEVIATPSSSDYVLTSITAGGETLEFTENDNGTYTATFSMPSKSIVVVPTFTSTIYTISYYASGEGSVEGDSTAKVGDSVKVIATAGEGYYLQLLTVSGSSVEFAVDESDSSIYTATFEMPAENAVVLALFYSTSLAGTDTTGTDSTTTTDTTGTTDTSYVLAGGYEITYDEDLVGGTLTGTTSAVSGGIAAVIATADDGYMLYNLSITDEDGSEIEYSGSNGTYTFNMPASPVNVTGTFGSAVSVTSVSGTESGLAILVTNDYDTTAAVYGNLITVTSDTTTTAIASNAGRAGKSVISVQNGKLGIYSTSAVKVNVYTLKGALVKSQNVSSGESLIGGLTSGVYMVRVSDGTVGKVSIR